MSKAEPIKKRIALDPNMTLGEVFERFPHARMLRRRGMGPIDPDRDADKTLRELAELFKEPWTFDVVMGSLNNCLVIMDDADKQIDGDESLLYWEKFHNTSTQSSPEQTWRGPATTMDDERIGLICDGGLPYLRWVLSDGLNAIRLQQSGPPIEMLTAFQRCAGMSQERMFDGGFIDLLVDGRRHEFDQVHVTSYGYDNRSKGDPDEWSSMLMYFDRIWLELARDGKKIEWVVDDSKMVNRCLLGKRTITRHGWDEDARCLVYSTVDDRPNIVGQKPKEFKGFSDDDVTDFIGIEWDSETRMPTPKHTECWIAIGGCDAVSYDGPEAMDVEGDQMAGASLHRFSADGGGTLMIGIGSTRKGALVELRAAREGQQNAFRRQHERYLEIARRCPRFEIQGSETLSEIAAMVPQFLESLKTGFFLMRSRPHTGAITGGWDMTVIAAPMMRMGDYKMLPDFAEFWLHQVQKDGQIYHVCEFDLSPAQLTKRWDFDDYTYLMLTAQYAAHTGDMDFLQRVAPKCMHMIRVMMHDADDETGLIEARGIYPDWPPLECGRKGLTYPAMDMGTWYEALRWWEGLTEVLGESKLSEQIHATAEKIRACYAKLFIDENTGMIFDAVRPGTLEPVKTFAAWSLTPFHGVYGHELVGDKAGRIAEYLLEKHIDLSYPRIKVMSDGEFPSIFESLHWPLFDHLVTKTMRRGNCAKGMDAALEVIERQYKWLHCAVEALNAYHGITNDFGSTYSNWFGWSSTGWYESLLSGAAGIWEEPGGLAYICCDMSREVKLSNLPYRGGVWDISITGSGKYISRFAVDGDEIPGTCKVPQKYLTAEQHKLEIVRSDSPAGPLVVDSTGLKLIAGELTDGKLHVSLAGPGRAFVRIYCPTKPKITDMGQAVKVDWNKVTCIAEVEITRTEAPGDLVIE